MMGVEMCLEAGFHQPYTTLPANRKTAPWDKDKEKNGVEAVHGS